MNLEHLKWFVRVASAGSFAKAARQGEIAKSSLTRHVQSLEQELGVSLLMRNTRGMTLTEHGQRLYHRFEPVFRDIEDAEREIDGATQQDHPTGTVRLTALASFARATLTPLIAEFAERYPGIRLECLFTDRQLNLIETGFDLGIRIGALNDSSLHGRQLGIIHRRLCVSPIYQPVTDLVRPTDLLHEQCLVSSPGSARWQFQHRDTGEKIAVSVPWRLCSAPLEGLLEPALRGLGIVTMPSFLVDEAIQTGQLVELMSDWAPEPRPVTIVHAQGRLLSPAARVLMEFICERVRTQFPQRPDQPDRPWESVRSRLEKLIEPALAAHAMRSPLVAEARVI